KAASAKKGDIIKFGGYDWRVLDVKDGKALIITDKIIETRAYNEKFTDVTWEICDLRAYLNGEFYNSFGKSDKARVVKTKISNKDNRQFGAPGGKDTDDYIFLLSIDEAKEYFSDFAAGVAYDSKGNLHLWWLRSPGAVNICAAIVDSGSGFVIDAGRYVYLDGGVRPAMWLTL
ncbi:MAG: DUF6273 domain-containing protein, partial [Oscillospiraceae bacterium]|nr:DUF6273 domain-containing protein [Oscillospiraceae bacterium]